MALKIDTEIVKTTMTETLMQNIEAFNAGTAGAIVLSSHYIMGDNQDFSKLAEIASLVGRRDISVDTDATVKAINSADSTSVICYFSTGSIEFKKVDARRYGSDVEAFSSAVGEQIGVGFVNYMLNRGIYAVRAAIESGGVGTTVYGVGTVAASYTQLNSGLALFGDASGSIVAWVMNGATYHDIVGDGLTNVKTDNVAGGIVATGNTATLGRPSFVTDADGLAMTAGVAILGLTVNALEIAETEAREIFSETVGGKENLKTRIQAESDVLIGAKGYTYGGTDNPTDAVLGLSTNWSQSATDVKATSGIIVNVL